MTPLRKLVLSLSCIMLLLTACQEEEQRSLLPAGCDIRPGDLLFRRGTGLTSHTVVLADKKGQYSHVGIAVDSAGTVMVVHAVPGEPDYEGDPDRVKMEPAEKFYSTINASAGEICRPLNPDVGSKAADAALAIYHNGMLFDHQYDSADTTKMYCTELVMVAYQRAGCELTGPPTHSYDIPGLKCTCWLPSDLYYSKHIQSVRLLE